MSSQTEENLETTTDVDQLAKLGIPALEQLRDDHLKLSNTDAADALQTLIDERKRVEEQLENNAAAKKPKKVATRSRKGSRAPKGRQVTAAETFNRDPENLARLKRILEGDPNHDPPIEPVIQTDGSYLMTAWLVQLGISGYYDERRREDKAGETKATPDPIIPASSEDDAEAPETEVPVAEAIDAVSGEVEAEAEVSIDSHAETQAEAPPEDDSEEEQTMLNQPINPYGTSDDE